MSCWKRRIDVQCVFIPLDTTAVSQLSDFTQGIQKLCNQFEITDKENYTVNFNNMAVFDFNLVSLLY
jgi:hypothetical protein